MKSRDRLGIITALIFFMGLSLVPTGCTYDRVQLDDGRTFSIERVDSSPIYVSWVHVEEQNHEIIITGLLRTQFYYTQGTGHVDVAVIGSGDKLLVQTSVDYSPKTFRRFRGKESRFEARFPFVPPDGSRIRVELHYSPVLELKDSDSGNNRAGKESAT